PSRPAHRPHTSGSRSHRPPAGTRRGKGQPLPSPSVPPSTTARHPASRPRLQRGAAHPSVPRHTDGAHEQDQPRDHTDRHIGSLNEGTRSDHPRKSQLNTGHTTSFATGRVNAWPSAVIGELYAERGFIC